MSLWAPIYILYYHHLGLTFDCLIIAVVQAKLLGFIDIVPSWLVWTFDRLGMTRKMDVCSNLNLIFCFVCIRFLDCRPLPHLVS